MIFSPNRTHFGGSCAMVNTKHQSCQLKRAPISGGMPELRKLL